MNVINWLRVQPNEADLAGAVRDLQGVGHLRSLLQALVHTVLCGHPWDGRDDLVPVFDSSERYTAGSVVAFPLRDEQELKRSRA